MERVVNENIAVCTEHVPARGAQVDVLVFELPLTSETKPFSSVLFQGRFLKSVQGE